MVSWLTVITNYNAVMTAPRNAVIKRVQLNENLATMFNDVMTFVREVCDPAAAYFEEHANEFFTQYHSARKLDPSGIHHTRLLSTVTNELGEVYSGQTITLKGKSPQGFTYTGTTDFNGNSVISGIEHDNLGYNVTVSGSSVKDKTFGPFMFERGKSLIQIFVCEPKFVNMPQSQPQQEVQDNN